ncbi:MAG: flagellar biosynthesis protein FlhF [Candidatus Omnitrophica bacterium]|nr:flagellar biosynthesis protein FlhF [Candidatus Omnitrophota bacterium]
MKVKRYEGRDIKEITSKIKLDLGPEATILFVKEFNQRRFLKKREKRLEVIAGVSEDKPDMGKLELIHWELKELKDTVTQLRLKQDNYSQPFKDDGLYPVLKEFKKKLCDCDVDGDLAINILKDFQERFTEKDLQNTSLLESFLIKHIARYIEVSGPIVAEQCKVVAFIGPTGVGKTTTIAKLAAYFSLMERKKVFLVTIDTYRIAAVDQLKTYAEIIGIPLEVVFTPQELLVCINKNKDKDLILIDTAGSNPFNSLRMEDLKKFLGQSPNIETHLLISFTTKSKELLEIFKCYNILKVHKIIFTKLDEAMMFGNILNLSVRINRPVSYITTGQNVPDDIELADSQKLAQLIVKGKEAVIKDKGELEKII